MEGIGQLKEFQVDFNILTVVNAMTAKKISRIYDFYKQSGFFYLQFIPCLNPLGKEGDRFAYTLTPDAYGRFLKTLFDLWYNDWKEGNIIHIQQFEEYIKMLLLMPPDVCGMSGTCSYQHVVEADGEVYPCDFYVLDEYKLGNLSQVSFAEINEKGKKSILLKSRQLCMKRVEGVDMLLFAGDAEGIGFRRIISAVLIMIFLNIQSIGWKKWPDGFGKIAK